MLTDNVMPNVVFEEMFRHAHHNIERHCRHNERNDSYKHALATIFIFMMFFETATQ